MTPDEQVPRDVLDKGKPMPLSGPAYVNSTPIPICAQQLTFHYVVWDFRAMGVYRADAMCSRLVHLRVAFLARWSQAVEEQYHPWWDRGGIG